MNKISLVYGGIYAIENGYNSWGGGFLDTRGSGCHDNKLCVSTNKDTPLRDGRSGIWKIIPANSKAVGEPVKANDTIHLQNLYYNDGTFLDTRGGGCSDNLLCVSAATTPNRDNGSGTWLIIPAETIDGTIPEAAPVRFLNGFNQFSGGFLDTRGAGCDDNFLCVSTSATFNRDGMSTLWRLGSIPFIDEQDQNKAPRDVAGFSLEVHAWGVDLIMTNQATTDLVNGATPVSTISGILAPLLASAGAPGLVASAVSLAVATAIAAKIAQIKLTNRGKGVHWPISWPQWFALLASVPGGPGAMVAVLMIFFHPIPN